MSDLTSGDAGSHSADFVMNESFMSMICITCGILIANSFIILILLGLILDELKTHK